MDDQVLRAQELNQLKTDLAQFALRLDAFEARRQRCSLAAPIQPAAPAIFDVEFARRIVFAMKGQLA